MGTHLLSEFEQEFELDSTAVSQRGEDEYNYEVDQEHEHVEGQCNCHKNNKKNEFGDSTQEFEADEELEIDEEFESEEDVEDEFEADEELDEEFESDEELDEELESDEKLDDEFEVFEETDYATFSRDNTYDRDREFESKIYNALVSHRDNELAFEMELDAVLHEMEKDYFFGAAKKWLKKKGLKSLKNFAMNRLPMSGALKALSALGRGDIRALLKNKLLQTAAGFIPVAGPLVSKALNVAGSLSNAAEDAKSKIQNAVQIGKDAYQDLANSIPEAQDEFEVRRNARQAFRKAVQRNPMPTSAFRNKTKERITVSPNAHVTVYSDKVSINKGQRVISLKQGSIVSVKPGSVTIWKTR